MSRQNVLFCLLLKETWISFNHNIVWQILHRTPVLCLNISTPLKFCAFWKLNPKIKPNATKIHFFVWFVWSVFCNLLLTLLYLWTGYSTADLKKKQIYVLSASSVSYDHAATKDVITTQNQCQIWNLKNKCCVQLNIVLWDPVNLNQESLNCTEIPKITAAMENYRNFEKTYLINGKQTETEYARTE